MSDYNHDGLWCSLCGNPVEYDEPCDCWAGNNAEPWPPAPENEPEEMDHLVPAELACRRPRLSFRVSHMVHGRMPGIALRWLAAPEGFEL